jgi:aspartyl-tRNA(Asn)/glutamyl-tRNA(Gln) amidotransferase subunit C
VADAAPPALICARTPSRRDRPRVATNDASGIVQLSIEGSRREGGSCATLSPMTLDREAVLHIARLARIDLTADEIEMYASQLSDIIGHFDVLNAVDTEGVEPTAHTLPLRNVLANDTSRPSLPQDEVLEMAPNVEDGYLRVRAVLE